MLEAHTGEIDPTNLVVKSALDNYREEVASMVLDQYVPFYDRLQALFATQNENWERYRTEPTVERMQNAQKSIVLIGGMVGYLEPEKPWSFDCVEDEIDRITGLEVKEITLFANFLKVREIESIKSYEHRSYGQTSTRVDNGSYVRRVTLKNKLLVRESQSEKLAEKIAEEAKRIRIGDAEIHKSLGENSLLQVAYIKAVRELENEKPVTNN